MSTLTTTVKVTNASGVVRYTTARKEIASRQAFARDIANGLTESESKNLLAELSRMVAIVNATPSPKRNRDGIAQERADKVTAIVSDYDGVWNASDALAY